MAVLLYWIASYVIGNFLTAWWVGKWKKVDLRTIRSGNLGARNAGAILGKAAFIITFLGDALKGVVIIFFGNHNHFSTIVVAIGGVAVILGHLFPLWLKFKGGKGIATFIGVAIIYNPLLFGILAVVFFLLLLVIRSATLSMLLAFVSYAIVSCVHPSFYMAWPLSIAIIIILIRHRFDVKESWDERWWKQSI